MLVAYWGMMAALRLMLATPVADPSELKIAGILTGGDSQYGGRLVSLCRTQDDFDEIWKLHLPAVVTTTPGPGQEQLSVVGMPSVDFGHSMVLALFGGNSLQVGGYNVVSVATRAHTAVIMLAPVAAQRSSQTVLQTNPYAFIEMNRVKCPIEVDVESGVRGDGEPVWTRIATFQPTG